MKNDQTKFKKLKMLKILMISYFLKDSNTSGKPNHDHLHFLAQTKHGNVSCSCDKMLYFRSTAIVENGGGILRNISSFIATCPQGEEYR